MSASTPDEPETIVEYRILWRSSDFPDGLNRWEECVYRSRDLAAAEATAERFARDHHAWWTDRRDYAVVEVARRPVRVFPAPAGEVET